MKDHFLVLNFECEDVTGTYISVVVLEKRKEMYVAHYADFDNVISISANRRGINIWIPTILRTLLANESGVIPKVKFLNSELHEKDPASQTA